MSVARPAIRVALALAALSGACAPRLMKLPSGAGQTATDAREAFDQATAACRSVKSLSAEVAASGSVAKQGLRGRLLLGVAAPASARLEAVAPFGQPIFILAVRGDDATLLLPRDDRVLEHGAPADVLEAVAGVPLDADGLRHAVTGCAEVADGATARGYGQNWRVIGDSAIEVYVTRDRPSAPWQLAAILHRVPGRPTWRAEYRDPQNGLPRSVRLASSDRDRFDLRLVLSQVEVNATLGPEVFAVQVPRSAEPITIDELRHARPGVRKD
jgi:outer membrane lipoprotein-sorting protein